MKPLAALALTTALVGCFSASTPAPVPKLRPKTPIQANTRAPVKTPPVARLSGTGGCSDADPAEACKRACDGGDLPSCTRYAKRRIPFDPTEAGAVLEKTCDHGELLACSELGLLLEGDALERDFQRAASLQTKACEGGVVAGCSRLAELHLRSQPGIEASSDAELAAATAQMQWACDKGYLPACERLGVLAWAAIGMPRDVAKARALLERACDFGRSYGCEWAVKLLTKAEPKDLGLTSSERGDRVRAYSKRRRALSRESCAERGENCIEGVLSPQELREACVDRGIAVACNEVGVIYLEGRDVDKDPASAVAYLERGCAGNMSRSCHELADLYGSGGVVAKDERKSFVYMERSCALGSSPGCFYLGMKYLEGTGTERDLEKSLVARRRACDWHDPGACQRFGRWLVLHDGVELPAGEGKREAVQAFQRQCGDARSCLDVLLMKDRGWGTPKDSAKARSTAQIMCDGGQRAVCAWLKDPVKNTPAWVRERDAIEARAKK